MVVEIIVPVDVTETVQGAEGTAPDAAVVIGKAIISGVPPKDEPSVKAFGKATGRDSVMAPAAAGADLLPWERRAEPSSMTGTADVTTNPLSPDCKQKGWAPQESSHSRGAHPPAFHRLFHFYPTSIPSRSSFMQRHLPCHASSLPLTSLPFYAAFHSLLSQNIPSLTRISDRNI